MDEISRKVLSALQDFLDRLTKADNLLPEQLTEAFMSATALRYQIERMNYPIARLEAAKASEAHIVERFGDLATTAPRARRWAEQWSQAPGSRLCAAIETAQQSDNAQFRSQVRQWLVDYNEPMDPAVGAGTRSTYAGGRGDNQFKRDAGVANALTAQLLQSWLHRTGNASPNTRVTKFRRLMGGFSKATHVAQLNDGQSETNIVIRKDSPGLPTGTSVTAEFPVLADMANIGAPVPQPLWIEPDPTLCAGAFIGVSFVNGVPANQNIPTDQTSRTRWARSCAGVLGLLHAQTSMPGADVREYIMREIDELQTRMLERERTPHPGLSLGLTWLRDNIDALKSRPACRVHGDFGFHNLLMHDDSVVAILDWEFSRIGDPVEDLASIKPFMEQIEAWDVFYAEYRDICGFTIDPEADCYFQVWQQARNMVACMGSLNSLLLPGVMDVPLTVAGTIYIPKYEIAVLDAIADAEKRRG